MSSLLELYAANCGLQGPIPAEFGNLSQHAITSDGRVDANTSVSLVAGGIVRLQNDFEVRKDAIFKGCIGPCEPPEDAETNDAIIGLTALADGPTVAGIQLIPNPFRASTRLRFEVPEEGPVSLLIRDLSGRPVSRPIVETLYLAGTHDLRFESNGLAPGIYPVTLFAGNEGISTRMVIIR